MSIIDDLPSKHKTLSKIWTGVIASTPQVPSDLVDVRIPDFSPDVRWTDCFWEPRLYGFVEGEVIGVDDDSNSDVIVTVDNLGKVLFPKRGNPCLCIFDNYNRIWVVMWWPY